MLETKENFHKEELAEIQTLPLSVVDQIAAGEVVERPAHLIKELVENSLDAGATSIQVDFSEGGRFVKIQDNGKGISKADLPKAIERFATSKIKASDDLWSLSTFGFRGEALASISSVSEMTILSRKESTSFGHRLQVEYGKIISLEETAAPVGTTVSIKNLFANVPARLKFMKSVAAETAQIKTTLKGIALANPSVEFKIFQEGKLDSFWPRSKDRLNRVKEILGLEEMFEGQAEREYVKAYAVFSGPAHVQKTSRQIWVFAQNRPINDKTVLAAVMEAYRSTLMHGEFPQAVIWIETDPDKVDVNVHPTKSVVKFLDNSLVFRAVQSSIRTKLEQSPWLNASDASSVVSQAPITSLDSTAPIEKFNLETRSILNESSPNVSSPSLPARQNLSFVSEDFHRTQGPKKDWNTFAPPPTPKIEDIKKLTPEAGPWSRLQVLGQSHQTFIIAQSAESLFLIDQHAAHERVMFERIMSHWRNGNIEIQENLFPLAVDLTTEKVEALQVVFSDLEKLGVNVEVLGPSTIGVKAAAIGLKDSALTQVLNEVAEQVLELGGSFSLERKLTDIVATMACHSAIRAGQTLSHAEAEALLKEMDRYQFSSFCPHGRPVSIEYKVTEIEKDFGRRI